MILSIDVGIRNLSMCCMSKENNEYSIHLWDNYDLISDPERFCECLKKDGKLCNIRCTFKQGTDFFCKRHSPQNAVKIKKKLVKTIRLQDIAIVVLEKINQIYIEHKELFDKLGIVLIEKQPRINQKMSFISNLIFGKFCELLKGGTNIKFVSAGSKAKLFKTIGDTGGNMKGSKGYKNRKNKSIEYALDFITCNKMNNCIEMFNNSKKRDDLSDTLAYCVAELIRIQEFKDKTIRRGKDEQDKH